jgi:polygalacturonase
MAGLVRTVLMVMVGCGFFVAPARGEGKFNVREFGAVGDGIAKDTAAFQKALDICAVNGGGEVLVPAGKYLIGSVQQGNRTIIRFEQDAVIIGSPDPADYPSAEIRWEGRWQPGRRALIYADNVDHIGIVGPGRIEGNPAMAAPQNPRGSVVLEPINCNDVHWEGFTVTQGGNWATHPTYCNNVLIKGVTIRGNRDGIDVDSCKDVRIEICDIETGDDCISLKSGRGMDGARVGKPAENITIVGCTMRGRIFACIGIGSETSAGVKNVRIEKCKMTANSQAIYIKTRIGRAGITEGIVGEDLDITGGGFLRINLITGGNTNTADDPVEGLIGYPIARDLKFNNVRLDNVAFIVEAAAVAPERPVEKLVLSNITGTAKKGMTIMHARDVTLSNIKVENVPAPMLATQDVQGTGLEGAVQYTPPPPAANRRGARGPATSP